MSSVPSSVHQIHELRPPSQALSPVRQSILTRILPSQAAALSDYDASATSVSGAASFAAALSAPAKLGSSTTYTGSYASTAADFSQTISQQLPSVSQPLEHILIEKGYWRAHIGKITGIREVGGDPYQHLFESI